RENLVILFRFRHFLLRARLAFSCFVSASSIASRMNTTLGARTLRPWPAAQSARVSFYGGNVCRCTEKSKKAPSVPGLHRKSLPLVKSRLARRLRPRCDAHHKKALCTKKD